MKRTVIVSATVLGAQIEPRAFGETLILTINAARGQRAAVERDVATALARTEPTIAFTFRTFDQFSTREPDTAVNHSVARSVYTSRAYI